jgi:predicted CXXCH cytochrome family protein
MLSLAAVVALGIGTQAYAFHDGGVAECSGCHSMHAAVSSTYLLVGTDQSSTCLSCHEGTSQRSYRVSTAESYMTANPTDGPLQKGPGGDFAWLRMDRTATASYGAPLNFFGRNQGHNIIAADNNYTADSDNPTAPGGNMPSVLLSCVSCHDPHGRGRQTGADGTNPTIQLPTIGSTHDPIFDSGSYGAEPATGEAVGTYRLLPGAYYTAWGAANYPGVPAAVAPSTYNRSEDTTQTRVAYGYKAVGAEGYASWGRWCSTCHPAMHTDNAGFKHKVDDQLSTQIVGNYNAYVVTGDLTGGATTSFTSLVPFAQNTNNIQTLAAKALDDDSDLNGPTTQDRLACFSCHRAHASAWKWALRWNGDAEFLTLGGAGAPVYPGVDNYPSNAGQFNQGYTEEQMTDAYYGRPATEFAAHQRVLCNKCHIKD